MTRFKIFQEPIEFEPMNCPDCEKTLNTADETARHFIAAHSSNESDEGYHVNFDDV